MSTDEDEKPTSCCKSVTKFFFSHVGMCVMVILYCVAGGFIFEHLEKDNEVQICKDARKEYNAIETKTLDKLVNQRMSKNETLSILELFRDSCVSIGYTGDVCELKGTKNGSAFSWSLPGAILFSITVVSTIGYGHISPKTTWGRLVCIAYSVIGIPLMLICLANLGEALADVFRFVYAKIICCGFCKRRSKRSEVKSDMSERNVHANRHQMLMNDSPLQTANNLDSRLRPMTKFINEKPPLNASVKDMDTFYESHYEMTKFMSSGENSNPINTPHLRSRPMTPYSGENKPLKIYPVLLPEREPIVILDESDYDDDDDDDSTMSIPLTITMMVIAVYLLFGAVLFKLWEGWDLLQSVYFCFITLSTIGFGDVVPGTDFENPQTNIQLIVGGFYILFGMAIVSMCFALMQEEMIAKFKMLMSKLTCIKNDD